MGKRGPRSRLRFEKVRLYVNGRSMHACKQCKTVHALIRPWWKVRWDDCGEDRKSGGFVEVRSSLPANVR